MAMFAFDSSAPAQSLPFNFTTGGTPTCTGTLSATVTATATFIGQTGVQGSLAATTDMPTAEFSAEYDANVFRGLVHSTESLNQAGSRLQENFSVPWQPPDFWRVQRSTVWQVADPQPAKVCQCLADLEILNLRPEIHWAAATPLSGAYSADFILGWPLYLQRCGTYRAATQQALVREMPYVLCWPLPATTCGRYESGRKIVTALGNRWQGARSNPAQICISWQPGQHPPFVWPIPLPPEPPEPPLFSGDPHLNLVCLLPDPIWGGVQFNLGAAEICQQALPVGWLPQLPGRVPIRTVYFVTNSFSMVRLPDRTPLTPLNTTISVDVDSWCWQFSATIAPADLTLVRPTAAGLVEIEITINGYIWIMLVEKYTHEREFKGQGITINGRSRSAWLAEPYAPARTWTQTATRTALQLAEEELNRPDLVTGFTLDWDLPDWLVDGGALTYNGLTPIAAISRIVNAVGGSLQSAPASATLIAQSRYPFMPWEWAGLDQSVMDIVLPEDAVKLTGEAWREAPSYNGVYVSGDRYGVNGFVKKTGTAGEFLAPAVVDGLITHADAARERGRATLGTGGQQAEMSIETLLLPELGLITPGMMIEIAAATSSWRGLTRQTAITAAWTKTLDIKQRFQVERHYD